jgi:hypothetical protein
MVGVGGCVLGGDKGTWEEEARRAMNWSDSSMVHCGARRGRGRGF